MLKELRKLVYLSMAVTAIGFSPSVNAAPFLGDTAPGNCTGLADGSVDCGTAVGHIGVSVIGTLSINELKAISFGNVVVTAAGAAAVTMSPAGVFTAPTAATLVLMHGADANGGTGGTAAPGSGTETGAAGNDGQQPGVYEIKGAAEGGQARVYIAFNKLTNEPLDANGDTNYPANQVAVVGSTGEQFNVDGFVFTAPAGATVGKDVYGNYIDGGVAAAAAAFKINVGATLHTDPAATYPPGKYVGEFNITATY